MAAKKTISASSSFKERGSTKRKGIHSKTKMSKNKASKNYVKVSRGQG
jgi:hypothetical protein